ncbi:hypothetical protein RUND412_008559 [Rhizina undulata]
MNRNEEDARRRTRYDYRPSASSISESPEPDDHNFPGMGVHKKLIHPDSLQFQQKLDQIEGPPVKLINDIDDTTSPPFTFECINELRLGDGIPEHQPDVRRLPQALPGLRCPQEIKKGSFIDSYLREVISPEEAHRRATEVNRNSLSYLFDLDKFEEPEESQMDYYDEPQKLKYAINEQFCGGITRFINQSCDPNLDIYTVAWNRRGYSVYELALFALRDIGQYE